MKHSAILAVSGLFGSLAAASACCNNRCVRAIVSPSVLGVADCSSLLATTVTPATSTITSTVTLGKAQNVTFVVSSAYTTDITTTVYTETIVSTSSLTVTESVDVITATQTETTIVSTETQTVLTTVTATPVKARRAANDTLGLPQYASVCGSWPKYADACSCIGAAPGTITAPTPMTTITVTETQTKYSNVTSSVLSTETRTIPVSISVSTTEIDTVPVTATTTTTQIAYISATTTTVATATATVSTCVNIVQNPGFDDATVSPWTFVDSGMQRLEDPSKAHSGGKAALSVITTFAQRNRVTQTINLVSGNPYRIRYWWAINSGVAGSGNRGCYITTIIGGGVVYSDFPIPAVPLNTWAAHEISFTAPSDSPLLAIYMFCNQQANGLQVLLDDVSVYPDTTAGSDGYCIPPAI
ncbi:hypothetical protein JX266_010116 [Neoarthrinium moseri]|nr:hypothetical protein JX266_010116 [Neoarthrinium moseri]